MTKSLGTTVIPTNQPFFSRVLQGIGKEALAYWYVRSGLIQGDYCLYATHRNVADVLRDFKGVGISTVRVPDKSEVVTHSVTVSEVISKLRMMGYDIEAAKQAFAVIPRIVESDRNSAAGVGVLHAEMRKKIPNFSLADAFVLEAARRLGAKVLTGDPDFKNLKEAEYIGID